MLYPRVMGRKLFVRKPVAPLQHWSNEVKGQQNQTTQIGFVSIGNPQELKRNKNKYIPSPNTFRSNAQPRYYSYSWAPIQTSREISGLGT